MKLIIFDRGEDDDTDIIVYNANKFIGMKMEDFILDRDDSWGIEMTFRFENDWNIQLNYDTRNCCEEDCDNGSEIVFIEGVKPISAAEKEFNEYQQNFRKLVAEDLKIKFFDFLTGEKDINYFDVFAELHDSEEHFKNQI